MFFVSFESYKSTKKYAEIHKKYISLRDKI